MCCRDQQPRNRHGHVRYACINCCLVLCIVDVDGNAKTCDRLRYNVASCASMMVPGEYGFVAQLNEGRASKKRPTEFRVDQVCDRQNRLLCINYAQACPDANPKPISFKGLLMTSTSSVQLFVWALCFVLLGIPEADHNGSAWYHLTGFRLIWWVTGGTVI